MIDETQTEADDDARSARAGTAPMLFVALECGRPEARSARYVLRGIDSVAIGRGKKRRRCARDGEVMRIEVPDRRMSSAHAVVERVLGRWVIVDKGSKNGVRVNGEKIERSTLEDGDVIETGWTLWRYRSALPITGDLDVADASPPAPGLGTVVPSLEESWEQLARVAASKISIVLGGESGTGKEVAARAIHQLSGRPGDFVAVNCGALPEKLVESELFGHVKGAFSGAASDRRGYVRAADGGTLLLDEIGDLPAPAQAALLRILEEREVVPIGGERPIPLDLRIVAASHRDLGKMVERGEFRADLFARLSRAIAIVWGRVEANDEPSTLWVVDVDGGVRSRRRVPIEGDLVQPGGISGVAWSEPGRLIYGQAADNGTGGELWEVGIDGSDPRRLRAWPDATVDWLDVVGGRLFFMKNRVQTDVYVGQLTAEGLATPERFSDSQSTDVFVGWSSDGRVLFSSNRNGTFDLFAGRPKSNAVELVAGGPGDEFGVGVEGGLVLWRRAPEGDCRLWFEPDGGGEPRPLLSRPRCDWGGRATDAPPSIACATRRPDRCVLAESRDSEVAFSAVNPASGEVRELYRHRAAEAGGLPVDVAADGGRAVFALRDPPAIATIDLDSGAVARHPFDLPGGLGHVALRGGDGGFITLPTWWTAGLLWLRPDGTHTQLWDRGIDRLRGPRVSPDGRHLGVTYIETETNVWVVDGLFGP